MVGYLFGMSRVESRSQSSSSHWPKVDFGVKSNNLKFCRIFRIFVGLGFSMKIMKFDKISQNLQRRCPPCRCLHAQCSRTPCAEHFWILIRGVGAPKTWKITKNHRKMEGHRFTRTETAAKWCRILFFCILDWFGVVYCTFLHPPCIFDNFFIEIGRKSRVGRLWCDLSGTL